MDLDLDFEFQNHDPMSLTLEPWGRATYWPPYVCGGSRPDPAGWCVVLKTTTEKQGKTNKALGIGQWF